MKLELWAEGGRIIIDGLDVRLVCSSATARHSPWNVNLAERRTDRPEVQTGRDPPGPALAGGEGEHFFLYCVLKFFNSSIK